MKKTTTVYLFMLMGMSVMAQTNVTWVSTTQTKQWVTHKNPVITSQQNKADVEIQIDKPQQEIQGFGTCFNELGWTSLNILNKQDREAIMKELFLPGYGANFTLCRMPIGANDFSINWYSYDETNGDFDMNNFSIAHDRQTLIPIIKDAMKYNPDLKLWASPWSPPQWMKYNKHYAARMVPNMDKVPEEQIEKMKNEWGMDFRGISNGLQPGQEGAEGTDMFVQDDKYFKAYSLYFSKFIQSYRAENINIGMVMPQNEFNSAQVFPSCTWTAKGLDRFLHFLVPEMKALNVDVFFGTMERANYKLVDTILMDPQINKDIKGAGFQWAGKDAIPTIHKKYPSLTLYQTEQECGNGLNDWNYCCYAWSLMKLYLKNGANAYMYWNTSLKDGGISTWGWHQNSLVSVDTLHKTYKYNYEYYLMKHLSHFVKPGATRLNTEGYDNLLAFRNKDNSIAIMIQNADKEDKTIEIKFGDKTIKPTLEADSFNTFLLR